MRKKLVNLRELRERAALSQGELADGAGISKNAVGQLERGEFSPRPATLRRLAEALRVRPEDLWESTTPKKAQAPLPLNTEDSSGAGEGLHSSGDVWRKEYLARTDEMLRKWEAELEEKVTLARDDPERYFEWLTEIETFGRPQIEGLFSGFEATTKTRLGLVAAVNEFLGPWDNLWRRIEQVKLLSEEDQRRLLETSELNRSLTKTSGRAHSAEDTG